MRPQPSFVRARLRRTTLLFCLCAPAALFYAHAARAQQPPAPHSQEHEQHSHDLQPPAAASARYTRTLTSYAPPDVTLVDMNGARVPLAAALSYDGPILMQFIFTTCPTICSVMSGTFSAAQTKLGPELGRVRMISISIDPEQDTPARLRAYARRFKAQRQWLFLTGSLADIVAIEKAFDVYRGNKMRHEPLTFLRASPRELWGRLDGLMSATELAAECRRLLAR
jgi:protein SCO1/2